MLKVIKNTYPHSKAALGDICEWRRDKNCFRLYRLADNEVLFATPDIGSNGLTSAGKKPSLVGIVGQVKSKGWIFEVAKEMMENEK